MYPNLRLLTALLVSTSTAALAAPPAPAPAQEAEAEAVTPAAETGIGDKVLTLADFGPGAEDESVWEGSWKWQISPNFSLMPDIQYLQDPANNPGSDSEWIFSLRGILTF